MTNFYPAVVEAHYSRVPLIVLTADRPHELREVGAPQAIDQQFLFGKFVKWFTDLALPEESQTMSWYVQTVTLGKSCVYAGAKGTSSSECAAERTIVT